jgi:hypothetical protein
MGTEINIPQEAYDKADKVIRRYMDNTDAYDIGSDVLREVTPLVVANYLDERIAALKVTWEAWREIDDRTLRSSGLGHAIREMKRWASELRGES